MFRLNIITVTPLPSLELLLVRWCNTFIKLSSKCFFWEGESELLERQMLHEELFDGENVVL